MSWVAVAIGGSALLGYAASDSAANKQQAGAGKASQAQTGMFNQTSRNLAPWMDSGQMSLSALSRGLGIGNPNAGPYDGLSLVSSSGGRPSANQKLYASDGAYKSAWDETQALHNERYPGGYNADSDQAWIEQMLRSKLPTTGQGQQGGPDYGSLTKPFGMSDLQESPAYRFNLEQGQQAIDKAAAARHNFYAPSTLQQISKYSQGVASNEFQNAYNNYNTNLKNVWDRLYALSGSGQNAAAQLGGFGTTVGGQVGENATGAANAAAAGQIGGANAIAGGVGSYYNYNMLSQYLANQQAPTYSAKSTPMNWENTGGWEGSGGAVV